MEHFSDDAVRLDLLRRRAHNRWARLPMDVIPLTAADPDFRVVEPIRDAVKRAALDGVFSYGPDGGTPRSGRPPPASSRNIMASTVQTRTSTPRAASPRA
jgi:hypothetical protein